jgi:peptidoglycan/xylan/chitin deacetylase (PgdA/CDA1 family)
MTYEPPVRARPRRERSVLDSPVLAGALVLIVVALVAAIVVVPGILPGASPRPSGPSAAPGTPTPTGPSPSPTFVRPTPSPAPTFLLYTVKPGDSLNSIAREFRTTGRSIAWWNRGTYPTLDPESEAYDPNTIRVGWVLNVLPDSVVDDENPPTPSPGPPTAPPATPGPAQGGAVTPPPSSGPATVVAHGRRTVANIALTFDMGGRLEPAVDIVQWLIDHEVHATLFPTGASGTTTAQGRAALLLAATRPDLFDFANHSWSHPDFRDLTAAQMAEQLTGSETALVPLIGTTKPWFRPPFGGWNEAVRAGVGAAGWRYVVMWDVDTIDWRPVADGGPTASGIVSKIANNAQNGSIVLMHLGGWNTLQALPGILAAVEAGGLEPVTLSEMFAA